MTKTLDEIFKDLSYGHLSNLAIGEEGTGFIAPGQEDKILSMVNQGLKALHSRFLLSEKSLVLRGILGRERYPLLLVHADSSAAVEDKFIVDTEADPFTEDVIRVLLVRDELGEDVGLNNFDVTNSAFIPKVNVVKLIDMEGDETFEVTYQANHPKLLVPDPTLEIDLPDPLYEALEAYVGYRILGGMNGQEHTVKAAELMAIYESICNRTEGAGISKNTMAYENGKLESRGFV